MSIWYGDTSYRKPEDFDSKDKGWRLNFINHLGFVLYFRDSYTSSLKTLDVIKVAKANDHRFALVNLPSDGTPQFPMYFVAAGDWESVVQNCVDLYEGMARSYRREHVAKGYWLRDLKINLQNVARAATVPEEGEDYERLREKRLSPWMFKEHFERQWYRAQDHLHEEIAKKYATTGE